MIKYLFHIKGERTPMDRRDFISNAIVGAGMAAAVAAPASAEGNDMEKKKTKTFGLGILTGYTPERLALAQECGYDCMSVQMSFRNPQWENLKTKDGQQKYLELFQSHGVEISSFADYANHLDPEPDKREASSAFCSELIDICAQMGVKRIAALAGRDSSKSVDDSLGDFKAVWAPLAKKAEDKGVQIAFENWVGGNDIGRGVNIAVCPYAWNKMFDAVNSSAIGLEFDPSHLYWQGIDYLRAAREFSSKIYQVHLKDCVIRTEDLYQRGCTGGSFRFCLPGWGEINWHAFFRTLWEGGFRGNCIVEHEDDMFSRERYDEGFRVAKAYLNTVLP